MMSSMFGGFGGFSGSTPGEIEDSQTPGYTEQPDQM